MLVDRVLQASWLLSAVVGLETRWLQQPIDHNSPASGTFSQRYLVDAKADNGGPLLFFCGNEGDVEVFANFSKFLDEAAAALQGEVVFAEHRFYGQSLPFGLDFSLDHIRFLTVEQALADYARLITFLTASRQRKVVAFGGSYGGMLSSWMRAKYPSLVFAAVSSSAPLHFDRVGGSFFKLVTDAAEEMDSGCADRVRMGFAALEAASASSLQRAFGLCSPPLDLNELVLWARNAFVTVAMGNYPYAGDLFGKGLQAWPLRAACRELRHGKPLKSLAAAVGSYYNATGKVRCHNISREYRDCADQTGCGTADAAWGRSWDIEACRQIVYFTSTNNVTDMFPPRAWGLEELSQYCSGVWQIQPLSNWFLPWLSSVNSSSRIIFTNGLLDPWRGGGVMQSLSSTLVSLQIPGGAHIYDLAGDHVDDVPGVRAARQRVLTMLRLWLGVQRSVFGAALRAMVPPKTFEVSRSRSRKWDLEVKSISRDGQDCVGACHWVFKSTSRSIPTDLESRSMPLDPVELWSKTRSADAHSRPSWSVPSARPCALEQWREKAPAKLESKQLLAGPSFWQSHGNGQGRYGCSAGHLAASTAPAAPHRHHSSRPSTEQASRLDRRGRWRDGASYTSSLRASSLFIGTLEEEQIRGRHSGPKFSPTAAKKLRDLTTVILTSR
ncbi:DPP7 [Symbiodinium sp. KB8]|nr:DPP7 [Symbiodinium sp. KB8]